MASKRAYGIAATFLAATFSFACPTFAADTTLRAVMQSNLKILDPIWTTAYIVRNYTDKDGKEHSRWTDVGGVWPHKKGNGFDVALIALPVDGRLSIRLDEPKPLKQAEPVG